MIATRRLPGLIYTHRYTAYAIGIIVSTFVYLLFKWNVFCVNLQAWQHVKKMCTLYEQGLAIGSLCAPLCVSKDIHSLTCHSFQAAKEAVFSAEWHNIKLVFKSVDTDVQPIHWYDNGLLRYPTEKEFLSTIRTIVKRKLNLTLAYDTASRLARLKPSYEEKDLVKRRQEMDSLWYLLQDNEYLLSTIFTDKDIFPQLIGTCGPYFAVEYLDPVPFTSAVFAISEDWGQRLKFALQILELLDELDTSFREPFHLCDVKLSHFGYVKNMKKLKYLDLDEAFPRTVINSLFKLSKCNSDDDCEFLDCRSTCNSTTNKCKQEIGNNNLQIVCEKIFLGWRMSNTVIVPGLLMSQQTPSELASILRQCANPEGVSGKVRKMPDDEVRKRLYNVLFEMEQSVNNDFFL
ncbi:divergent protein kinase domain 1C [Anthonomus grandis grandis]|uniref:divergent protein kinase domain 1C n=1 Tax=Anthonomus grandis grandis TaxID=2921223 RepID=UPI002165F666|nr:divergent protein kinase domain 1C [Anthonomus grandis grandis]XP_050292750.1 divergent protein kinase domain 1C [Anthonomus grandis grandis]XP_050292751.1 divergent protein kinase domain 1C [Anthonomus grandis grandis]